MQNLMYAIGWLPTFLVDGVRVIFEPRRSFKHTYKPSDECKRKAEQKGRNILRLASYKTKRRV